MPTASAVLSRSTSPSGTMFTTPATDTRNASDRSLASASWLTSSRTAVGTSTHVTPRRITSTPARSSDFASTKRRPSVASRRPYGRFADDFGKVLPAPRDDPRAGQHRAPLRLRHRLRLAGEQRLVDFEVVTRQHHAVDDDLIPPSDLDDVAFDDVTGRHFAAPLGPHHGRGGAPHDHETIEGALGADLLDDADQRVAHEDDAEQRVLHRPHDQDHDEQRAEQRVEAREDVRANDRRHRAARLIDDGVAATGGGARLGLFLGRGHRGPVRRQGRRCHDYIVAPVR